MLILIKGVSFVIKLNSMPQSTNWRQPCSTVSKPI